MVSILVSVQRIVGRAAQSRHPRVFTHDQVATAGMIAVEAWSENWLMAQVAVGNLTISSWPSP
jgi:hypothetical protein